MSSQASQQPQNGNVSSSPCILHNVTYKGISHTTQRYYLSRHTLLEMLKDRGFNVADSQLNVSVHEFKAMFGDDPDPDSLSMSFVHASDSSKKMLVIFLGPEDIRVPCIRGICCKIPDRKSLHTLMLITQSKMTAVARKELDKYPFRTEFFRIEDLFVNITKHSLMPKHEILTAEERDRLLDKYKLERKQLPMMLASDPISRYYGLEKGQVLKVSYKDGLVNSLVTYRCVV